MTERPDIVIMLGIAETRGQITPERIAAQTGTPLKTVKTRLARGLALLRERLERT